MSHASAFCTVLLLLSPLLSPLMLPLLLLLLHMLTLRLATVVPDTATCEFASCWRQSRRRRAARAYT